MKILNWMHSKLHPTMDYSRVSHKKGVFEKDDTRLVEFEKEDTESLLLQHVLDGILTIGTFGNDHPLLSFPPPPPHHNNHPSKAQQEQEQQVKVVEAATATALFVARPTTSAAVEEETKKKIDNEEKNEVQIPNGDDLLEPLLKEDKEKRERVTLADLFSTTDASGENSSAHAGNSIAVEANSGGKSQAACRVKHGKKLTHRKKKGEDSPPTTTNKLHRLITRMLRKKIHPELEREEQVHVRGGGSDGPVGGGEGGFSKASAVTNPYPYSEA